ncbi:type II toxin-antitoxin system RelB/DinJ family antitoxin [Rothia sp. 11254D007CT]
MATSVVNVRLDEQTKRDLEILCQELGITVSAAFSMFAKKMTREQRIPFEVSIDPFYSEANVSMLRRSVAQVKGGNLTERELIDE